MDDLDYRALKVKVFDICFGALNTRLADLKAEVVQLRLSIANDSKSSMGDKYETSREMMQQEINRLEQQIASTGQQLFNLKAINLDKSYAQIEKGSLVQTSMGLFFIAVSYGEVKIAAQSCFVISELAPLAKLLFNMRLGGSFELNKKLVEVLAIY